MLQIKLQKIVSKKLLTLKNVWGDQTNFDCQKINLPKIRFENFLQAYSFIYLLNNNLPLQNKKITQ